MREWKKVAAKIVTAKVVMATMRAIDRRREMPGFFPNSNVSFMLKMLFGERDEGREFE